MPKRLLRILGHVAAVLLVAVVALGLGRWAWVTQTAPPSHAVPAAALADPNGRFIRVNGVELYFTEDGSPDGAPIVLVPGARRAADRQSCC
ncbi:MAG: hypothetical protein RMN52_05020 [Anaerolineae bacterium]|nr:hypothetical protein [Candidatus Roseilinea sp.]MDW8449345.1 hypothetical protein [Anaerolineae bacterium]